MDTSEEYIEMCSKLPSEIRERVPRDHQGCMGGDKSFFGYHKKLNGMVWLPRQDQLQDMVVSRYADRNPRYIHIAFFILQDFSSWFNSCEHYEDMMKLDSREKITLCWIMHEKCGLNWSSEQKEWIK